MKIICVGRNYTKHIKELKNKRPKDPVLFLKPDSSILSKDQPFVIPPFSKEIHHEVEVLVKINRVGKYINSKFAHKYYNEIGLGIDFTARDIQRDCKEKGLPWEKSKSFDGSALIGEFLPKSNFKNLNNIHFSLLKNNTITQSGNTSKMLWKIDELIAYISQFFTLKTGDIIFTGTPSGVGSIAENDELIGMLENHKMFRVRVR